MWGCGSVSPSTCTSSLASLPTTTGRPGGAQGHSLELASLLNIVPQYEAIQAGTWNTTTVTQLNAMLQHDAGDLIDRLNAMSDTLEQVTPQIDALD